MLFVNLKTLVMEIMTMLRDLNVVNSKILKLEDPRFGVIKC